ncbi:Transcriptional regulator PadR-like family protein [Paramicrobacterium humi]|uniref:Transcriptional regulator PadR-like family protein n=1 Tax=Paramicrobacterium humi TaxID=640635 RepID=A0A1H4MDX6_9MICO|nr:PadR family transcriptional regulator [Microbacterium humi]SEB81290.1 Transcriptional regulator PadR-like family protein [Microbacterium humi]
MTDAPSPMTVAVLGYLAERPMHPYEICQVAVHRGEDSLVKISPGSVYRAVYRLAEDGCARALDTEREGARPERTPFEITDAGRRLLADSVAAMLGTVAPEFPAFPLALAECHTLPLDRVIELLESRTTELQRLLDDVGQAQATAREGQVPTMYLLQHSHERARLLAEIGWLENLIRELRDGSIPWRDERDTDTREAAYERARSVVITN